MAACWSRRSREPATRDSFHDLTGSHTEFTAWQRFYAEVGTIAAAVAPTLLTPLPRAATLRAAVDPTIWADVVDQPLGAAIERRFTHDLVRGVVGTDALIGTFASLHDPTLIQNRCFLYHLIGNGTGEWRVPVGGMGAVTGELERVAREAGVTIRTDARVTEVEARDDHVTVRGDDFSITADWLLSGVAPYVLDLMRGHQPGIKPSGSQLKVNLLLSRLPRAEVRCRSCHRLRRHLPRRRDDDRAGGRAGARRPPGPFPSTRPASCTATR